jgi:O-antigen ligase
MFKVIVSGVIGLGLFLFALENVSGFRESFTSGDGAVSVGGMYINTSGRLYWWGELWNSFKGSLAFGTGLDVLPYMHGVQGWDHPHNDYLRILHHHGLVGFFLWIAFNFVIFVKLWRGRFDYTWAADGQYDRWLHTGTLFATVGIFAAMATDNLITYTMVYWPFFILSGFALGGLDRRRKWGSCNPLRQQQR